MTDLNTNNTKALVTEHGTKIENLITFFATQNEGISWDTWFPGDSAQFLEELKVGLVGLASCVEVRLQEIYAPDHQQTDFGV